MTQKETDAMADNAQDGNERSSSAAMGCCRDSRGGTISVSWGNYGGFYFRRGYTLRLCFGWIAVTYFPRDLDDLLNETLSL